MCSMGASCVINAGPDGYLAQVIMVLGYDTRRPGRTCVGGAAPGPAPNDRLRHSDSPRDCCTSWCHLRLLGLRASRPSIESWPIQTSLLVRSTWRRTIRAISPPSGRPSPGVSYPAGKDRKSTRLNSSHVAISYAVFCLKKKNNNHGLLVE